MPVWTYQAPPELSDEAYRRWQNLLEARTGISFLQHKSILQKGLLQRMREVGAESYDVYYDEVVELAEEQEEWALLVDSISIKETSFFRDSNSYALVNAFLLERVEKNVAENTHTLDLWSVGCATGEEAYSLAMIANDVVDYLAAQCHLSVTASDISRTALADAARGCYKARRLESITLAQRAKYFARKSEKEYEVRPELKQRMRFAQGNILDEMHTQPKAMELIYCQNVLIYFRRERQWQALDSLVRHLKPGGLLVIGPGEVFGWKHPEMSRSNDESVQAYIKQARK